MQNSPRLEGGGSKIPIGGGSKIYYLTLSQILCDLILAHWLVYIVIVSDSPDKADKTLCGLAEVLEEAMPDLSYDRRNVAYVSFLFQTGETDDPNNIGMQSYLHDGLRRESGRQMITFSKGGRGAAEEMGLDHQKYNLKLTAKEREDLVQGISKWYKIKADRLRAIRNSKGAIMRGHKVSQVKAKKAYQEAHFAYHDYVGGNSQEANQLKGVMNEAKEKMDSLEDDPPKIQELEAEAKELNKLLGKDLD